LVKGQGQAYQLRFQHGEEENVFQGKVREIGNFFLFPMLKKELAVLILSLDRLKKVGEDYQDIDQR
jgi:hypothetical protein